MIHVFGNVCIIQYEMLRNKESSMDDFWPEDGGCTETPRTAVQNNYDTGFLEWLSIAVGYNEVVNEYWKHGTSEIK